MSEVRRYSPGYQDNYCDGGFEDCKETDDGELVSYQDYVELKAQCDALAAENASIKESVAMHAAGFKICPACSHQDECETDDIVWMVKETPATDAYLNSVRAEGIHFAANRILAAWDAGFIDDSPAQVHDITGAVLSALEFLPDASPGEFKRDFADEIRSGIASQLRAGEPS